MWVAKRSFILLAAAFLLFPFIFIHPVSAQYGAYRDVIVTADSDYANIGVTFTATYKLELIDPSTGAVMRLYPKELITTPAGIPIQTGYVQVNAGENTMTFIGVLNLTAGQNTYRLIYSSTLMPDASPEYVSIECYKEATVTATSELTEYQVNFFVFNTTGIDSGFSVYLGNNTRPDFGDVHFQDVYGNELPFWLEYVGTTNASFWVKIPSIAAAPAGVGVRVCYGNPARTTSSNGESTFIFFDDFSIINATKWSTVGSGITWEIDGGALKGTDSVGTDWATYIQGNHALQPGECFHAKIKVGSGTNTAIYASAGNANDFVIAYLQTTNTLYMSGKVGGSWDEAYAGFTWSTGNWYDISVVRTGTLSFRAQSGGSSVDNSFSSIPSGGKIALKPAALAGSYSWFDNAFVRKWAATEPTVVEWGVESSLAGNFIVAYGTLVTEGFAINVDMPMLNTTQSIFINISATYAQPSAISDSVKLVVSTEWGRTLLVVLPIGIMLIAGRQDGAIFTILALACCTLINISAEDNVFNWGILGTVAFLALIMLFEEGGKRK